MADAKATLRLFKVVTDRKLRVPAPIGELHPGANHFELSESEESSSRLLEHLSKLVSANPPLVTVEILDAEGNSTPWNPSK